MGLSDPLITFRRVPERAGLDREALETFAATLQKRVVRNGVFHCRITGDAELRRLNAAYLGKRYPADVLSFPSEGESRGDLAISLHRAAAQAKQYGHTLNEEIQLLMLHGVLHLIGMDHEVDDGRMARVEQGWRAKFGLPATLTERVCA